MTKYNRSLNQDAKGNYTPANMVNGVEPPLIAPTMIHVENPVSTFPRGTYYVAYSWVNQHGETTLSPVSSITVGATQRELLVNIPPLPKGATAAAVYLSANANLSTLRKQGETISIRYSQKIPLKEGHKVPSMNTTYEWASPVYIVSPREGVQDVKIVDTSVYLPTEVRGISRELLFTTTSNLGGNAVYTSPVYDMIEFKSVTGFTCPSHAGTLYIQQTDDQVVWYTAQKLTIPDQTSNAISGTTYYDMTSFDLDIVSRYVRFIYVNGGTTQTRFILTAYTRPI